MRVIHMDSGLGNQMLDFAELLAIQDANPDGDYYLETLIYELPHYKGMFSQWNGYELERIFGIRVPNVKQLFTTAQWENILKYVEESRFWEEDWNYAPYIVEALRAEGIKLDNRIGDRRAGKGGGSAVGARARRKVTDYFRTRTGYHVKRYGRKILSKKIIRRKNMSMDVFQKYPQDVYTGHSLVFRYKGFGIERIDNKIRKAFCFPEIMDERNRRMQKLIHSENSVAIHARRSDMLFVNGDCYKYGFFKRSVHYIKKYVQDPVFVFFCDERSTGWCESNPEIFGLDFKKDKVHFVDWNRGDSSFRDMQLMAECKHNIFTQSSFGFWGAYLNRNPDKITCAPDPLFLATNSF